MTGMAVVGPLRGKFSAVGFTPDPEMDIKEADRTVGNLLSLEEGCPWWIGDLLNWAEAKFGEEWSQLLAQMSQTGWDTAKRHKQVAAAYPQEKRVEGVSFTQHRELMSLPEDERERWLVRVALGNLSCGEVRRLRYEQDSEGGEKTYPPSLLALIRSAQGAACDLYASGSPTPLVLDAEVGDGLRVEITVRLRRSL